MVANDLDMPLHILNAQDEFCERVVLILQANIWKGRRQTPVLCVIGT